MTPELHDPAIAWHRHVDRLTGARRDAVVQALRHSASTGWPASEEAVRLLVAYAEGGITAREYAHGIMRSFGDVDVEPKPTPEPEPEPVPDESTPAAASAGGTVRREDAVQAYVTGQIPVGEFLRIARS